MNIKELTDLMNNFVTEKGWYKNNSPKPQTPKNLSASLCIESAEVMEHFQWHEDLHDKSGLADELADVALYLLQLSFVCEIDLEEAILNKLEKNRKRNWSEHV